MKIALVCLVAIALIIGVVYLWGSLLPVGHETKISKTYQVLPEAIYSQISNFKEYPQWRTGVKSVEMDGGQRFIEESIHGKIPYVVRVNEQYSQLATEIDDPSLPFSGMWTFEISPKAEGAILTIIERGEVRNPFFRFISKYVFSHEKTINTYLADLDKRTGQGI